MNGNHQGDKKLWHWLMKPSTLEFIREGQRTKNYHFSDWLHGYIYARWPYLYISIGLGEHPLSKRLAPLAGWFERLITHRRKGENHKNDVGEKPIGFADTYHGKVLPLASATQLVKVNENICLPELEKIIPYARARDLILMNPTSIAVLDCPCRIARENPCLPLDVCLIVGEPFVSFVLEHHPRRARRITQEEAAAILKAEDDRGHVHHAFFKDAMLNRFYAICNCCSCCCGAMQAQRSGTPMLASSGYISQVDESMCIGCGDCIEFCQFDALSLGTSYSVVDQVACMGCGVCVSKCEQGALSLIRAPQKGEPLELHLLMSEMV